MFRTRQTSPGARAIKSSSLNRCGSSFFELHTGPVAHSDHDQRPDTRPIEARTEESQKITLQNWGHPHTPRDCRRLIGLSYAAMGSLSMAAVAA